MSVFDIYEKSKHLERANILLNSDFPHDHYYASLELRFCIEAIVYQRLLHGIGDLPKAIVKTWQPHKAMKMLEEMDDLAASSCEVHINKAQTEEVPKDGWIKIGEQKIPDIKWLTKNYHKLGNFLHLTEPEKALSQDLRNVREKISQIAKELESFMSGNLVISSNSIDIVHCPSCKYEFLFDLKKVKDGDERRCNNKHCGAVFRASRKGLERKVKFHYKTHDINCHNCGEEIIIPAEKIIKLDGFKCNKCNSEYLIKASYEVAVLPRN
ncbi:hypothetical protein CTM88_20730 [Photobacterium aquimaris]|uniref:Uncharacterized protein n=1 Tax=Photobacterium aquimaris TaxID=512643 RepID=A0A2T3IED7_9GAMM|nr:hypothetical protein [Photobacterium aquimaris]OBU14447.1 hypothetical protein AYY20_20730 [Photobacterium aquimaris]PSU21550.1 hypothetical protein CTM88_20730 [Photobacterium aquimaris]